MDAEYFEGEIRGLAAEMREDGDDEAANTLTGAADALSALEDESLMLASVVHAILTAANHGEPTMLGALCVAHDALVAYEPPGEGLRGMIEAAQSKLARHTAPTSEA